MPNYNLSDKQLNEITEAILAGQKIQAIKMFVDATGYGLKEAKEEIEALMGALAEDHPEILKTSPKSGAIVGVLILGIIGFIIVALLYFSFSMPEPAP